MEFDDEISIVMENSICSELESIYCASDKSVTPPVPKKRRKKPRVTSSWSFSAINDLILAVEKHPCVWKYSSPDYKDRCKRDKAWREIQEMCPGHMVEDCKGKWANVKTVFQNVKKKIKTKSGQGAENTQPHWPHWSAMQFYNRHDLSKSTCSVSTLDVQDTKPCCSNSVNSSSPQEEKPLQNDIMQRAVKYLETEEDNWNAIGMYLASQMREIAKKSKKAANKLHIQLVKTAMEANLEAEYDS